MIIDTSRVASNSHWPFTVMAIFFIGLLGCLFVHWIQATFRKSKNTSQPGWYISDTVILFQLFFV